MSKIEEYREADFGLMILAGVYNYLIDRGRTLIDENLPCRDVDRAIKLVSELLDRAKVECFDWERQLSSVGVWNSAMNERLDAEPSA